jgi:hypothetical protein
MTLLPLHIVAGGMGLVTGFLHRSQRERFVMPLAINPKEHAS